MTAPPGWFPDPRGPAGLLRYWDGIRWTDYTASDPGAGAFTAPAPRSSPAVAAPTFSPGPRPVVLTSRTRWWLGGALVLLVAVVVLVVLVRTAVVPLGARTGGGPGGDPTPDACPAAVDDPTPPPQPAGRVSGGGLSFPALDSPFERGYGGPPLPFVRNLQAQQALVEPASGSNPDWVSVAGVGAVATGDGFAGPKAAAELIATCAVASGYGDVVIDRQDRFSTSMTVDGHAGWQLESHLGFDIPGLQTRDELIIVVVVDTGNGGGVFFGSVPDTSPQFLAPTRRAMAGLRIDG